MAHFPVNTEDYDVIIGYRADDSYFSFAEDFVNNAISVRKLEKARRLGNLGEQVVLVSRAAFDALKFVGAEEADRSKYYVLKIKRDKATRAEYLGSDRKENREPLPENRPCAGKSAGRGS